MNAIRVSTVVLVGAVAVTSGACGEHRCDSDLACGLDERCDTTSHKCTKVDGGVAYPVDGRVAPDVWGCGSSQDCELGLEPICDLTDHQCRECQASDECEDRDVGSPHCDESTGACVQCLDSALHCVETTPVCDASTLACRGCVDDPDCEDHLDGRPACTTTGACVGCTDSVTHCAVSAPICEPTTSTCRACVAHADCDVIAGGICDYPSGECLGPEEIVYVDKSVSCDDEEGCDLAVPCCTIQAAVGKATIGRFAILVADGTYERFVVSGTIHAWVVGGGSSVQITDLTTSPQVEVADQANLILENVLVGDPGGANGYGVECNGLHPTYPIVELRRNRIVNNTGGGVSVTSCHFRVYNNVIAGNGSTTSSVGGCLFNDPVVTSDFRHNTVSDNLVSSGGAGGVQCLLPMDIHSSIIQGNFNEELGQSCIPHYSLVEDGTGDASGTHNVVGLAEFVGNGDFHLQPGSTGVDVAAPTTTLARDIDGESRCQGSCPDMGADEVQ